ncbi:MAG: GNAT family N-acetyltransferase, partial [Eubacterium sp.]|nr:GNAT family N-acetyltransferase [Eubacterium sp.]
MQAFKSLWHQAFYDTREHMDYYFTHKAPRSRAYNRYEGPNMVSMMFFTPYQISYFGEEITGEYIVGVATEEKYRSHGYMTKLMGDAIQMEAGRGVDLVFLSPNNPEVYESMGFVPVYWRLTTY